MDYYDPFEARSKFKKKMTILKKLVTCEFFATIIFFICLWLLQIDQLWSEKYIDTVVQDWKRNPFVEFETIDAKE